MSYTLDFVDQTKTHIQFEYNELISVSTKKVVVSTSGPLVAMAVAGSVLYSLKIGDEKWIEVDDSYYDDAIFHRGKFYVVDVSGRTVSVCGSDLRALEIVPRLQFCGYGSPCMKLVESNGELFLIDKFCKLEEEVRYDQEVGDFNTDEAVHLKIYKLNEEKREWARVNDLDDHVFFVGDDCSYSISARDYPGLEPNCVYFYDYSFHDVNEDEEKLGEFCADTGVYCLDEESYGPLANYPDQWPPFLASPNLA